MYSGDQSQTRRPVTTGRLQRMKADGEKIVSLTAYDYTFAVAEDRAGVDVILVGDSLGMVMQGRETTVPVTVDDMVYHTRCVADARTAALVVADMPFMSYATVEDGLRNAGRLMQAGGAQMIKLEGAGEQAELVSRLARAGIPVCAHLGLQPQLVHKLGGYRVQGRDSAAADAMLADAQALQDAGADLLVLECVPSALGKRVSGGLEIPVIGIGAGPDCDGQVLVLQDILGITPGRIPRFSRNFMEGAESIPGALEAYVSAVREGRFPDASHSFGDAS
ncbi:ketopantoate hydroxymethyltransferase [Alkalispirillum mobile]|uniref:3-methyl-2-oxobutanoate hydroxymethyltransferase n=1 Tax=Alkalispirillum mobile TaxID=85925 RepID=A0A498CFV5_9GAMM|nr:3-methyl-2-oxobutanoate hydroxymethyltransferase [Alkalispirillum mobile]RLK51191.1 ketopantoate hydroxymethyltransferase [Alkalispirillum mobile]